jgi:hypothetical protein
MSRLYITRREIDFFSDITKEVIKDVVGQKIYYYPISELKTKVHGVYNEALKKVFDNPIAIDCLVDNNFQSDTKVDMFGVDAQFKIEVYVQWRDLVEKGINVTIGDMFSFSDVFYEISERVFMRNIYGMPEHKDGVKLIGTKARESLFKAVTIGPTDISRPEPDAVQNRFVQQRGFAVNKEGPTADNRALVQKGVLDLPADGPREVSPAGDEGQGSGSSFYDDTPGDP